MKHIAPPWTAALSPQLGLPNASKVSVTSGESGTYRNSPQLPPTSMVEKDKELTCLFAVSSGGPEAEKAKLGGEMVCELIYR